MKIPDKPSSIHSKKLNRFTRRRLVKALSTTGLASTSIAAVSLEDVKAASSDQIPIALDVEGNSIEYVDADWYDRLVQAREARKALDQEWLPERSSSTSSPARDAVVGVWLDAGTGNSEPHVIVSLDREAKGLGQARGAIPERKNGVPVRIEETEREEELTACNPNQKSSTADMPGGLGVVFRGSSTDTQGTLAPRVFDNDSEHDFSMMTAAHVPGVAAGDCGSALHGMEAKHNGDTIGEVVAVNHNHDFAVIYESGGTLPMNEVWNPEDFSETYDITSTMTVDAVDTWMDQNRQVEKYGIARCYGQGNISARGKKEIAPDNFDSCTSHWHDTIRWGTFNSIGKGDSGSITFGKDPNNSGYLASNINSWRWFDYSAGPAGYAIERDQGYYWA